MGRTLTRLVVMAAIVGAALALRRLLAAGREPVPDEEPGRRRGPRAS